MELNSELAPQYDPTDVEKKWYQHWEKSGYFRAQDSSDKKPFSILLPPPNVTGVLHIGHALGATLGDILTRWHRMLGDNTMWLPGTDHASIATHIVIERRLMKEDGKTRHDIGREAFLEIARDWTKEHRRRITQQLRVVGASCDWDRERFTLDEQSTRAVNEAFVRLYEEKLIYRANRLINWCPRCQTALSDLEVEHDEAHAGHLWHIAYPVTGSDDVELIVATTRPETMLGDTAVAVHPEDKRFKHLIGKTVTLPLIGREIPIIGDEILVDMEFGSGAVKVTPAHDFNDFETGVRHDLEMISIFDENAVTNENTGPYAGLSSSDAREKVLADLKKEEKIRGVEDHTHSLGTCQRCQSVVEPYLSQQWFVDIKPLATPAREAVENGDTVIIPQVWTKTYLNWMNNIQDWCISRQLWWGHQIPAWYCDDCGETIVSRTEPEACNKCGSSSLTQDPDVLDTWFSSGLWPMSTLGWPDKDSPALSTFYPTDVMETGYDIIFFWVARMMMMGLHFMGEVPFKYVYLHGMVRAADGDKMSKVKGNVVDPLEVVAEVGADALRFYMAMMTGQGTIVRMDNERLVGYRNFINKVWNAARFALPYLKTVKKGRFQPDELSLSLADRWLLSRLNHTVAEVKSSMDEFRFSDAASAVYHFFWHELCDWYLELVKPVLNGEDGGAGLAARQTLLHTLDTSLRLLHPFMPFVTEEIWQKLPIERDTETIMLASYPQPDDGLIDTGAVTQIELIQQIVVAIRNLRAEMRVAPSKKAPVHIRVSGEQLATIVENQSYLIDMARIETLTIGDDISKPAQSASAVISEECEVYLPLEGLIDLDQERARLGKEVAKQEKYVVGLSRKLSNEQFISKAPPDVVRAEKDKLEAGQKQLEKLRENLEAVAA